VLNDFARRLGSEELAGIIEDARSVEHRVFDASIDLDDALSGIDQEGFAAHGDSRLPTCLLDGDRAIGAADLHGRIADQWKGKFVLLREALVRIGRVHAHADDLDVELLEFFVELAKSAHLGGARGRAVFQIKEEDDAFADEIFSFQRFLRAV